MYGQPALPGDVAQRMIPAIRRIAHQLAKRLPRHIYVDDLVGAGLLGLCTAYSRFDPARGGGFQAYAESRIRGAMLDELRANDPLSRDQRALVSRCATAVRSLHAHLGRAPETEEIAAELGMSLEAYWDHVASSAVMTTVTIEGSDDGDDGVQVAQEEVEAADDQLAHKEARAALRAAVQLLPPRLLRVLELHYSDGLTLAEIGAMFGVTESRVCQLQSEAVRILRMRYSEFAGEVPSEPTVRPVEVRPSRRRSPEATRRTRTKRCRTARMAESQQAA